MREMKILRYEEVKRRKARRLAAEAFHAIVFLHSILYIDFMDNTQQEILNSIHKLSESMDDVVENVNFIKDNAVTKKEFEELRTEVGSIKAEVGSIKAEVGSIKAEVGSIKSGMATKDYIDKTFGTLKGDNVILIRKEDAKVNAVVDALEEEKVLPHQRVEIIRGHHVFPAPPIVSAS